ncbi:cholesterol 25-hydroxylase-like protein 2 [Denticeps clupeoides]|uniref:cholesterol 25-hydroxylase-like protein 2 n=1 Tax=Denticeps clupeoides TaxID=299321 RepID=UPI0010A3A07C|nr:cholesterol 25-hydroxylase-like protein 2 [Denticeps clupeoides]
MERLNVAKSLGDNCEDVGVGMTYGGPERSLLQPAWDYLRSNHQDTLRSPLLPVYLSVSTYFLSCLFYSAVDVLSSVFPGTNCYRIHSERPIKKTDVVKALGLTLYYHMVLVFPASLAQWYWRPPLPLPKDAPGLSELLLGLLGCLLLFDFQYFLWHLVHHRSKWLYVLFHSLHHEFSRPFSWVTQYMSAWELISLGFWTTVDPVLLCCHPLTGYIFMVLNVVASVDDHSGYDFPWALHHLVPLGLWGGPVKHDIHHQKPSTNFAPYFSHWDWLVGSGSVARLSSGSRRTKETIAKSASSKGAI